MDWPLFQTLERNLAKSDSKSRKAWAAEIATGSIDLEPLFALFDSADQTSQRFMWLLGDVCELEPDRFARCMPLLFSLRNEMPFPGMPRSVAKWLMLTGVPTQLGKAAIDQLVAWVRAPDASIACKSYSAKALVNLLKAERINRRRALTALSTQLSHPNSSYACRIQRLIEKCEAC